MSVFEMSEFFLESGAGCHAFRREAQCGDTYGLLRMEKWRSEEIEK